MSMVLLSQMLVERELKDKKEEFVNSQTVSTSEKEFLNIRVYNSLYYLQLQKELELLKKLDIQFCNLYGTLEDVIKRLESSSVIILPKEDYSAMVTALQQVQQIKRILKNDI